MKISCLPVSIFGDVCSGKMDIVDWAREAKKMGYDGIDISIMFLKNRTPTYIAKLKKDLEELEMPIIMMTTYTDFSHPDEVQREREYLYMLGDIAICSELNIKYLRILAGQDHPGIDRDEAIANVIHYFRKGVPYAEKYGVGLLYEDHAKPGAWDNIDFSLPPDIFYEIYKGIEDTSIGINYDTGNITAYGADTMELIKKLDINKIKTIHVTDMAEYGKFAPVVIGTGVVPNKEVFKYIKEEGFDEWICIEEASGTGLAGIKTAYDYVKKTWDEV